MKIIIISVISLLLFSSCAGEKNTKNPAEQKTPDKEIAKEISSLETVLGEATTEILDSGENRIHNIKLACEKINGTEIASGENFSFNEVVGKRNEALGFKNAPIISHGEKSYGTGGGICQVSSTIYIAALNSGLEIIERHPHSEAVKYAPGKDATVAYGTLDFRFCNNTESPVFVYTWIQDGLVYAKIVKKTI